MGLTLKGKCLVLGRSRCFPFKADPFQLGGNDNFDRVESPINVLFNLNPFSLAHTFWYYTSSNYDVDADGDNDGTVDENNNEYMLSVPVSSNV